MPDSDNRTAKGGGPQPNVIRGRITKIAAEKFKNVPISGVDIGVEFDSVTASGNALEIQFTYHAIYKDDVGRITLSGYLVYEMDELTAKRMADKFAADKDMEPAFMDSVVNNINYKCSTDAIFPARILDLTSPIMPPRIGLKRNAAAAKAAKSPAAAQPAPAAAPAATPPPAPKQSLPPQSKTIEATFNTGPAKSPFPFPPSMPPTFKK